MRDIIREDILKCLDQKPADFEEMLKFYRRKDIRSSAESILQSVGKNRNALSDSVLWGEDFTEDNLIKVIAGEKRIS